MCFVHLKRDATGIQYQVECGRVIRILIEIAMRIIVTIFGIIKMSRLQRINRVMNYYLKKGVNKEKVNEVYRSILKEKWSIRKQTS